MKKSWLTAASALAAIATAPPASAQLFSTPGTVDFGDTLVGATSSQTFGVIIHEAITSGSVPAATAPFSGGPVSLISSSKGELTPTYDFAPTVTGTADETLKFSAINLGLKIEQSGQIALTGVGVAPVESLSTSAPAVARIGTSSLETVTVSNTGDGNLSGLGDTSNLRGTLGASTGVFAGAGGAFDLGDSAQATFDYNFTPTAHGTTTGSVTAAFQNGSADGKNQSGNVDVALSGQGVGPTYDSSIIPRGVINFGAITLGGTGMADLEISNVSTDPTYASPTLTQLSLLAADIQPAAENFFLQNFVSEVLNEGDSFDLKIGFDATQLGMQTADLVVTTDQGAAFGASGETFDYQLMVDVVPSAIPEPRTWEMLLLGFGLVGLQGAWNRRSQKS
jgi:hypothetical protein